MLIDQLKTQSQINAENVRSSPLPEDVMNKIRELNGALLDNRKLMGIIQKLTNEKKILENELDQLRKYEPDQVNYNELSSWVSSLTGNIVLLIRYGRYCLAARDIKE